MNHMGVYSTLFQTPRGGEEKNREKIKLKIYTLVAAIASITVKYKYMFFLLFSVNNREFLPNPPPLFFS